MKVVTFAKVFVITLALFVGGTLEASPKRIVSMNGSMTEALFAVGAGDLVVGVDTSSVFPSEAQRLPKIGYQSKLSAEGILSLRPDLVVGTQDAGPPEVIEQIRRAGIRVEIYQDSSTVEGAYGKVLFAGKHSGHADKAVQIVARMRHNIEALKPLNGSPRVLFIYARGPGMVQVSGTNTQAAAMLKLVGATTALPDFEGFKPLTSEALVVANPDIILMPTRSLESIGGIDGLLRIPGVALTKAGKERKVVAMDDMLLLGFSARLDAALVELIRLLSKAAG